MNWEKSKIRCLFLRMNRHFMPKKIHVCRMVYKNNVNICTLQQNLILILFNNFQRFVGEEIEELRRMLGNLNLNGTQAELISQNKNLMNELKFVKDQNIELSAQLLKVEVKNLENTLCFEDDEAEVFGLGEEGMWLNSL